jgi:hypothetical protein
VGPNHYVQIANTAYTVFKKDGTVVLGPIPINTVFKGFGGSCESDNDGDPVAQYDEHADRWIISQFAGVRGNGPYFQCVAISTTGDPTGQYYRYSFQFDGLNDYPKLAVWPDGYYFSFNIFGGSSSGSEVCALDRVTALSGGAATTQCFQVSGNFGDVLPADLDGKQAPPAGSPNYIVGFGSNVLSIFQFHVDWKQSSSSSLSNSIDVPVAAFSEANSVPQSGGPALDSLSDRLMYRLAYRNFGAHESLVVNHAVDVNGRAGVRWYEVRSPHAAPAIYQQGTFAPNDGLGRWMGSIAMDSAGNIGLGYSVSNGTSHPAIRYTGRLSGDPMGQMSQGEATIINGTGAQTTYARWGDYSSMTVDPVDDCTFWFTTEYMKTTGARVWHTRVASFKFPSCGGACTPNCTGKQCGDDGCGGTCGACATGQTCSAAGQCQSSCTPSCTGKQCGDNGCGGSCGTCSMGQSCSAAGQCQGGGCAHAICSTGAKLTASCDPCATKICASDSFCCSNSWDSICVGEVKSICGQTCP